MNDLYYNEMPTYLDDLHARMLEDNIFQEPMTNWDEELEWLAFEAESLDEGSYDEEPIDDLGYYPVV